MTEHLEGPDGSVVAVGSGLTDVTHVAAEARQPLQSGFLLQELAIWSSL